jgi:xanthosine utilization system XapX-like protein
MFYSSVKVGLGMLSVERIPNPPAISVVGVVPAFDTDRILRDDR